MAQPPVHVDVYGALDEAIGAHGYRTEDGGPDVDAIAQAIGYAPQSIYSQLYHTGRLSLPMVKAVEDLHRRITGEALDGDVRRRLMGGRLPAAMEDRGAVHRELFALFEPHGFTMEDGGLDVMRLADEMGYSRSTVYGAIRAGRVPRRMMRAINGLHERLAGAPIPAESVARMGLGETAAGDAAPGARPGALADLLLGIFGDLGYRADDGNLASSDLARALGIPPSTMHSAVRRGYASPSLISKIRSLHVRLAGGDLSAEQVASLLSAQD